MTLAVSSALTDDVVRVSGALYRRGWMEGTAGNVSIRSDDGGHVLITASGRSKGELTAADVVAVDLSTGAPVSDDQPKASAETWIHLALYRAFGDVGAVLHAHPPYATAAASRTRSNPDPDTDDEPGNARFERFEIIKGLGVANPEAVDLPVFANRRHVPDIAADITRWFARVGGGPDVPPALLIAHHGVTAWGADIEHARNRLESVEALCRLDLIVNR